MSSSEFNNEFRRVRSKLNLKMKWIDNVFFYTLPTICLFKKPEPIVQIFYFGFMTFLFYRKLYLESQFHNPNEIINSNISKRRKQEQKLKLKYLRIKNSVYRSRFF